MRKIGLVLGAALVALFASFSLPAVSAFAKRHQMGMPEMITTAKTSADHEKLAAQYEREAKAARAKAEEHKNMADAYRKAGGPLIEKLHFDQHCDALVKSYTATAEEFEALAKAEREAAKEMKK
jgi:hypothetical protein